MEVHNLYLRSKLRRDEVLSLQGEHPSRNHYDATIAESVDAFDADTGRLVFRFRTKALSMNDLDLAREVFGDIDTRMRVSFDRKSAAGKIDLERIRLLRPDVVAVDPSPKNPFVGHFILKSGRRAVVPLSNPVTSYRAGYNYDRYTMLGKPTGFTAAYPDEWRRSIRFFDSIGDTFESIMPDESKHMREWCLSHAVLPPFTIGRTCLSTVAINVNYESCYHFDHGDLPSGYSTLTALAVGGPYDGGQLVLPQYRVAIDIRDGDLLCSQSHVDLHGNMNVTPLAVGAKRVSFVTYLKKMLKHAKNKPDVAAQLGECAQTSSPETPTDSGIGSEDQARTTTASGRPSR